MNILPQITQITQTNTAELYYFAEKDRLFEVKDVLGFGGCLRKSARSARDLLFPLCKLLEYSCVNILPQITQMTQRNAASSIISQRKTGCLRLRLFCCFGVCLRKSARSAGDFWGFVCVDCLSTLACYFPADSADDAEECSKLHYPAEKDRLFEVKAVLLFRGLSA